MHRSGRGKELLPAIVSAQYAVVFLSVPWSAPERVSRQAFLESVADLSSTAAAPLLITLEVDGDSEAQSWLLQFDLQDLCTAGAGSLLWVAGGRVVSHVLNAGSLGSDGILSHTEELWDGGAA